MVTQKYDVSFKESSSKVSIHVSSDYTDVLPVTLVHLYEYKEKTYIIDSYWQHNKKKISLSSFVFEDKIINSLIGFHAFTGNNYIISFYRKGKAAFFKILQGSSKFQSMFAALGNKLEYIWWHFKKTGRISMSYLRYVRKRCECSSVWEILHEISEWKQSCWYFNSFALLISILKQEGQLFRDKYNENEVNDKESNSENKGNIHSKSTKIKGEFNTTGHLQNFKK